MRRFEFFSKPEDREKAKEAIKKIDHNNFPSEDAFEETKNELEESNRIETIINSEKEKGEFGEVGTNKALREAYSKIVSSEEYIENFETDLSEILIFFESLEQNEKFPDEIKEAYSRIPMFIDALEKRLANLFSLENFSDKKYKRSESYKERPEKEDSLEYQEGARVLLQRIKKIVESKPIEDLDGNEIRELESLQGILIASSSQIRQIAYPDLDEGASLN
ncbi:hypothetical protein KC842_00625 [Candidatus Nomurabacteria bacterium]|nr:hypothetical protein [Candidatus Nomurabacteria bacterium]USN94926.1 MAG: hypothetical protein H6791_00660 [Candidatus Nomurabacteria bacterium]